MDEAACWAGATCRAPSETETTINPDELSELNVTNEAVDELDELVVDDKAKLVVALLECQCIN